MQKTDPPFQVGDRVLIKSLPGPALTILSIDDSFGSRRIHAAAIDRDFVGAPAEIFVKAPSDYADPPVPVGGLAKRRPDPAYQSRLRDFHSEMVRWALDHAARINPLFAVEIAAAHEAALDRLAGRDPAKGIAA